MIENCCFREKQMQIHLLRSPNGIRYFAYINLTFILNEPYKIGWYIHTQELGTNTQRRSGGMLKEMQ
jgi:hypothetical protein